MSIVAIKRYTKVATLAALAKAEYERVLSTFANRWMEPDGDPTAVYIGCPHNTYDEILYWAQKIDAGLKAKKQEKIAIPVYMGCSRVVRNKLLD